MQETCRAIVAVIGAAIEAEPARNVRQMSLPGGPPVGRQITIDATEEDGRLNRCHFSILNSDAAPAGESARVEYEHERQGKFETRRVYSVQSVRRQAGKLVLMENFIAENAQTVREEDFKPITSEPYARKVLESLQGWAKYRTWQLQQARK